MAQRISRAKQAIRDSGARFELPGPAERPARLGIVLHVLYLIFNEGYTATGGTDLTAPELSGEAIRLTRWLHRLLPQDPEIAGLLALMLLTDARRDARTGQDGSLIPLGEQDRSQWDPGRIAEGVALISAVLPDGPVGPYQVQAAIAAVHDEAESVDATDWPEILGLYDLLEHLAPGPMVSLNRAVAVAMVTGPDAGLDLLERRWSPTGGWRVITGCTRPGRICWRCPATPPGRRPPTGRPRAAPPACPSAATWPAARPG